MFEMCKVAVVILSPRCFPMKNLKFRNILFRPLLFPDESGKRVPGAWPHLRLIHPPLISDASDRGVPGNDDFCILFAPKATVQVVNR